MIWSSRNPPKEPGTFIIKTEWSTVALSLAGSFQQDSSPKIKLDLIHYKRCLVSTRWPWSLTPPWCAERKRPSACWKQLFLEKTFGHLWQCWYLGVFSGPIQVKQIKAQEMETSSPHPLPSSRGRQAAFWCPILAQFRRERGDGTFLAGWGW